MGRGKEPEERPTEAEPHACPLGPPCPGKKGGSASPPNASLGHLLLAGLMCPRLLSPQMTGAKRAFTPRTQTKILAVSVLFPQTSASHKAPSECFTEVGALHSTPGSEE